MRKLDYDLRDVIGGVALILLGITAMAIAADYTFGNLRRMGPGFFPVVLGGLLCLIGAAIVAKGFVRNWWEDGTLRPPSMRAILHVCGAVLAFVLTGDRLGFIPATLLLILISALADHRNSLRTAIISAIAITAVGVSFFTYVLEIRFTLLQGFH
ncbi:tripartite tricarboxylate transporter TctB family protein [Roseomonas sp. F4]